MSDARQPSPKEPDKTPYWTVKGILLAEGMDSGDAMRVATIICNDLGIGPKGKYVEQITDSTGTRTVREVGS